MAQMKGIRSDEKRVAPLGGGLALRGGVNLSAYEYNSCKYTAVTCEACEVQQLSLLSN
jgi:hypothetical protein